MGYVRLFIVISLYIGASIIVFFLPQPVGGIIGLLAAVVAFLPLVEWIDGKPEKQKP